jgi:L-prolyl-PCP dehydrogenase
LDYLDLCKNLSQIREDLITEKIVLCGKAGFFKHCIPANEGGYNDSFRKLCEAHRYLGHETNDSSLILSINAHLWGAVFPITFFGDHHQKSTYLPFLLKGEFIAGHAITEPEAGSDINFIQTEAKEVSEGFILNGKKIYISNSTINNILVVYAKTLYGLSAFILHRNDRGILLSPNKPMACYPFSPIGEVVLEECFIPKERLLGNMGSGKFILQSALELERVFIFSGLLGIVERQWQQVINYSKTRKISQGYLIDLQNIKYKLAEINLRLETIKLWLDKCCILKDQNKRITRESSMTKIFCSEALVQCSLDIVQILGALGLEQQFSSFRIVMDALASRILSGTNEIQKNIISSFL